MKEIPEWLRAFVDQWCERLTLHEWRIEIYLERIINDEPLLAGMARVYHNVNIAHVLLRNDIEDTPDWRQTILHELLHVRHARIDHAVENAIIEQLPANMHDMAATVYNQALESYIDQMAKVLMGSSGGE